LIGPDYARLWFGQAVSSLGDVVFGTTLMLWVGTELARGKAWAPAAVSGVLMAIGAAMLFVGPLAGVLVDRWDSRRTALGTEVVRGCLAGALTAVSFLPVHVLPTVVWLVVVYVAVFGLNVAGQFFQPARLTLIRDILTGEVDRARAAGIAQATSQTVTIIGPPLAAPLLFTVGVQWALLFNTLSYAVSYWALRSVPSRSEEPEPAGGSGAGAVAGAEASARSQKPRGGLFAEFAEGLRFFRGNRTLVTLLTVAVIGQCGIAPLDTLNVFFVTGNLHASTQLYGYLGMALGVGGLVGALGTGLMVRRFGARTVAWTGIVTMGVLLAGYSRLGSFWAALIVLFLLAIPMTMVNTAVAPLLMGAAPREFVGRTAAVFNPVNQLAGMGATIGAGWLLSSVLRHFDATVAGVRLGPVDLIFLVAGGLIICSGLYARTALRPETEPGQPGSGDAGLGEEGEQVERPAPAPAGQHPAVQVGE
ncbi:MAG: MFS transporter, partial [Catenulispora sp.]|nr:MFS transporter [Catenulispora sp.]